VSTTIHYLSTREEKKCGRGGRKALAYYPNILSYSLLKGREGRKKVEEKGGRVKSKREGKRKVASFLVILSSS